MKAKGVIVVIVIILVILVLFAALRLKGGTPGVKPPPDDITSPSTNQSMVPPGSGLETSPDARQVGAGFGFGVGYIEIGKAGIMSGTGAGWARQPLIVWSLGEPTKPVFGRRNYKWDLLDTRVEEWAGAGFDMQLILKSYSMWASEPGSLPGVCYKGSLPQDEYQDDYAAWVQALVERYDADGEDDMPGLARAVPYYEIESEAHHAGCWDGTIEDYKKQLGIAYGAVKAADPDAKVILSGFDLGDTFDDFPTGAVAQQRMDHGEELYKQEGASDHLFSFVEETLKATDSYDIIELHYNRDYKGIYGEVNWIRKFSDKPIWAGDAASGPWVKQELYPAVPLYDEETDQTLLESVGNEDPTTLAWYRKEQAKLTAKKVVAGMDAGLSGIVIENIVDWGQEWNAMNLGNFMFIGLLDADGNPKPAYYTYKLLIEKLGGFGSVERLDLTGDIIKNRGEGVWAFRLTVGGKDVYVLWYEDNVNACPICSVTEDASTTVDLSSYLAGNVKATHIITEQGETSAESETADASSIEVGESPVIVESI